MRVKNLTPDDITIVLPDGTSTATIYADTPHAHLADAQESAGVLTLVNQINVRPLATVGLPLVRRGPGPVRNLPEQSIGRAYIVLPEVAAACPDRTDLLVVAAWYYDKVGQDEQRFAVKALAWAHEG